MPQPRRAGLAANEGSVDREGAAWDRASRVALTSRGPARERPGSRCTSARLPCTLKGVSPALLVLFAAARARVAPARRRALAARVGAATKEALARNRRGAGRLWKQAEIELQKSGGLPWSSSVSVYTTALLTGKGRKPIYPSHLNGYNGTAWRDFRQAIALDPMKFWPLSAPAVWARCGRRATRG